MQNREQRKLSERIDTLGKAVDSNANILRMVVGVVNIICLKLDINQDEVLKSLVDELKKDLGGKLVQPQGTGADAGDLGQQQSGLPDQPGGGTAPAVSQPKGQSQAGQPSHGDFPSRDREGYGD